MDRRAFIRTALAHTGPSRAWWSCNTEAAVAPRMVYADGARPELREGFPRSTFNAMVEGVGPAATEAGLITAGDWTAGRR